ncbi:MAG: hypothetical protein CML02_19515 [Pseudooceanicola sp.]|nr:hypothetical protein [Pseudooceanicola sp.]
MPDISLTTQAALLYDSKPGFDPVSVLDELNTKHKLGTFALDQMATPQFALLTDGKMHATIAVHANPIGAQALARALASPVSAAKDADFPALVNSCRAHVVISVGSGTSPVTLDAVEPAPVEQRLKLLFALLRMVHRRYRCRAAHLCTSDLLYTPKDLDIELGQPLPPALVVHPELTRAAATEVGGSKPPLRHLIGHNSQYLLGRTLIVEDIPDPVPLDMAQTLLDTLLHQATRGALPLAHGDRLSEKLGTALYVRHLSANAAFPAGRIVVSFSETAPPRTRQTAGQPFLPHPGYAAISGHSAEAAPRPNDEWTPDRSARDRDTDPVGLAGLSASPRERSGSSPTWMILVGVGLFLWIGLPLLNVPQKLLQATFSDGLTTTQPQQ